MFEVPEAREFQTRVLVRLGGLTHDPLNHPPPTQHIELVRMADFLGVDSLMEMVATNTTHRAAGDGEDD